MKLKLFYHPEDQFGQEDHYYSNWERLLQDNYYIPPVTLLVLEVDDYDFPVNYKPLAVSDRFWKKDAPEKVKKELLAKAQNEYSYHKANGGA